MRHRPRRRSEYSSIHLSRCDLTILVRASFRMESGVDCAQERFFAERFEQEIHCSLPKSPRARLLISMSRDEDDRDSALIGHQPTLKLEPVHSLHAHVEHQAIGDTGMVRIQE